MVVVCHIRRLLAELWIACNYGPIMARASFKRGAKIERWERALDNPQAALKQIGSFMVSESQGAFQAQGFGKEKWKPRAVPNIYGIIADFHAGKERPPKRRFEARDVLVDTGRLKGPTGVAWKIISKNTVEVGSNLPYAGVLHAGGKIESLPITQKVRDLLAAFLKGPGKEWRKALGFLFSKKVGETLKGEVEARPFVGITKQTEKDILEAVGVKIFEVA